MKALIVEDDYTSRTILRKLLMPHGEVHVATDGEEAVAAFKSAQTSGQPFDLVCLDIMLPELDGLAALEKMRALEAAGTTAGNKRARIIMTTALNDKATVVEAIKKCDGYLVKPYQKSRLLEYLQEFGLSSL